MARVRIPLVVLGPDGRPLAGATAAVRRRSDASTVNVYAAETGGTTLTAPQIVTDAGGRMAGWTDRGALEATITGPAGAGLTPYIVQWEALPAGDSSAEALWVPDDLVVARMVGVNAVDYASLAADVLSALVPLAVPLPYPGSSLPAGGRYAWADGGLIDRTTYAAFFAVAGHAYNGGVDPGGNMVRKPDRRGRVTVGADQMPGGSAAGRLPNSNRAAGQSGGEERHTLTTGEMPSHGHSASTDSQLGNYYAPGGSVQVPAASPGFLSIQTASASHGHNVTVNGAGGGAAHNVLQPYEVDNFIVRII